MSSPILDMENVNMCLGPSNMGRCGNGRGVHFGGVTMHPLTVGHPIQPVDWFLDGSRLPGIQGVVPRGIGVVMGHGAWYHGEGP